MLNELQQASKNYVSIAVFYNDLVEECASLEFIAINAGIASKQANNDSFMTLSSEIQAMSNELTRSANQGRSTAFRCLDSTTQGYAILLALIRFYGLFHKAYQDQPKFEDYALNAKKDIEQYDISRLKSDTSQMTHSLENLIALVNIGKTMAIGGKIKAVYITGSEEKFRIITETMQASIDRLFKLLENIADQLSAIRRLFADIKAEQV